MRFKLQFSIFILILLHIVNVVPGQSSGKPPVRTFDAQHYVIRSSFDRDKKTYFGDATVSVKPLSDDFRILTLDAVGLNFSSVSFEGSTEQLAYKQSGEQVHITLGRSFTPSETVTVRLKYQAKPKKGVYFVDASKGTEGMPAHSSQVWTQGEPQESRHWFPSYDFPDDKATTEQFITVPNDETAVSNGELIKVSENPDGTKTFHYKMPVAHSTYLTSMIVGKYVKVESKYKNIPLAYYVYPGTEKIVEPAYGKTPEMMRIFEELTGIDYPYNKYDQTFVAQFNFGGMENITATTMADSEIFFSRFDFGRQAVMDLVSHELAHSWFGNLVTTKDWSNLWLNEGFATFMEAAFREKLNGRKDYIRKVTEDAERFKTEDSFNPDRHPLLRPNPPIDDRLFDTTTYQKGGVVLHMLREEVGDDVFWKAVNIYLKRHQFASVETADLRRVMEEVSGKDLGWFFAQWVENAGYPKLSIRQRYDAKKKQVVLTVSQTHKSDSNVSSAFRLPLEIEFTSPTGKQSNVLNVTKRSEVFTFDIKGKPGKVVVDKDQKIPLKSVSVTVTAK